MITEHHKGASQDDDGRVQPFTEIEAQKPITTIDDDEEGGEIATREGRGLEYTTFHYDNDPELRGLTLYEKKSLLVNRDLDAQGMRKYQWCIFLLCGFGYFLDLLWAQAFGLVVASIQQEFGFDAASVANISSSFNAGLCAGAFVWGVLVDIIGRYWAFNFTVLWSSVFGLVLGTPNSYNAVLVLTAFMGIGIGGNIPIGTTITLECLPQNRRWLLPGLSLFQPLGVVVSSLLCYAFIPNFSCTAPDSCKITPPGTSCCTKDENWGWRYVMFTQGAITLTVFWARFLLFKFQESPKYLLYRGQDEKAVKALQYIAKVNKQTSSISMETFAALEGDNASTVSSQSSDMPMIMGSGSKQQDLPLKQQLRLEFNRLKILFSTPMMTRITLLVWVIYMFDYWGFTIAGSLLPYILRNKGAELGLSTGATYRSYVYIYLLGLPGVLMGAVIYRFRFISMLLSSALFGTCLFIFTTVHDYGSYISVNGLVYFFQSMFDAILYGMTPEFFLAPIRGTACGISSFWGRVFGIISPLIAGQVLKTSDNGVLHLAGAGVFVCTICIALLPKKLWGAQSL